MCQAVEIVLCTPGNYGRGRTFIRSSEVLLHCSVASSNCESFMGTLSSVKWDPFLYSIPCTTSFPILQMCAITKPSKKNINEYNHQHFKSRLAVLRIWSSVPSEASQPLNCGHSWSGTWKTQNCYVHPHCSYCLDTAVGSLLCFPIATVHLRV